MITLNLSKHSAQTKLLASSFPEWADVYICDNCGRDITNAFSRPHSHTWAPMAPERFRCACGRPYLTGAIEWDNLADSERRRRIHQMFGLGVVFSVLFCVPGLIVYLVFRRWRGAAAAGLVIAAVPFLLLHMPFWWEIASSMWRTRVSKRN